MTVALIFDTETTDTEPDREMIEMAYIRIGPVVDLLSTRSDAIPHLSENYEYNMELQRFKPTKPISHAAMAVHHIIDDDLENFPAPSSFSIDEDVEYLIGHSIDFDWETIGKPDVKRICTDAMSRHVWPNADGYSQSALIYMLLQPHHARMRLKNAHSAAADVENNLTLLIHILRERPEIETWSQLHEFSEECRIPLVMPLGKHKDKTLDWVVENDYKYVVDYLFRQDWVDPYLITGLDRAIKRIFR